MCQGQIKPLPNLLLQKCHCLDGFIEEAQCLLTGTDETSRRRSFDEMKKVLRAGMHICLYPEGTRNRTQEPLKVFYDGAFKLAVETKKAYHSLHYYRNKKSNASK